MVMEWMRAAKLEPIDRLRRQHHRPSRRAAMRRSSRCSSGRTSTRCPRAATTTATSDRPAAIEVAQTLAEHGIVTRHPIEVVVWQNEEGGLYGSRAVSGQLTAAELKTVSNSGKTIEDGIRLHRRRSREARRRSSARRATSPATSSCTSSRAARSTRAKTRHRRRRRHRRHQAVGGDGHRLRRTTPARRAMDQRHDALLSAARVRGDGEPRRARRVRAVRSEPSDAFRRFPARRTSFPARSSARSSCAISTTRRSTRCTRRIRDGGRRRSARERDDVRVRRAAREHLRADRSAHARDHRRRGARRSSSRRDVMPSGAGHDAQAMAVLGPMGMIFIPSVGGISHSPKEFSRPADIVNGANVLLRSVLAADKALA